jgi:hypothetical protein
VSARRLQKLSESREDQDTVDVVRWLENGGQERFRDPILLPPILSIGVKDKSLANLAETPFRRTDLLVLSFWT